MTGATIFYKMEDQNLMLPKMTSLYLVRFIVMVVEFQATDEKISFLKFWQKKVSCLKKE